jgi:hypothetical protein
MLQRNILTGLIFFIVITSCEKDESKTDKKLDTNYQLTITRNSIIFQRFRYNDVNLLSQINYDNSGVIKEKIYYTYSAKEIRKDFYSKDSVLAFYQIYRCGNTYQTDSIITYYPLSGQVGTNHAYIVSYSDHGQIDTITDKVFSSNEHLEIVFAWLGKNLKEKKFPLGSGFPQYFYDYDDKPSIYQLIKAPIDVNIGRFEVAEIPISENNIKKVNIKKIVNHDFIFDTLYYELYHSTFIYNEYGYISSELRQYNSYVDKYEYKLDTLK